MRLVRFGGAISLDGYIAGPAGEFDWIVQDPEMNYAEKMAPFDTFLVGRKTFEVMVRVGRTDFGPATQCVVCSTTLRPEDYPKVVVHADAEGAVRELRAKVGKDIALFGGGELLRSLLAVDMVDRVEVSLIPILLGCGIPLLPAPAERTKLKLLTQRHYAKTGIMWLEYEVVKR